MYDKIKRLKNQTGFTLVEVMCVGALIAIGAAVAGFTMTAMLPDIRLKGAVRDMKSDLNAARLLAVRNNALVSVAFDLNNNQYTVFRDDGAGGGNVGNGQVDGTETVFKTVNMPFTVTLDSAAFGFVGPFAQFDSRGLSNVGGGSVGLKNDLDAYRGVSVSRVGKVQVRISTDGGATWVDVDPYA